VSQLMEYDKKFIILGTLNAITCKEIFQFIKENKIWLGCNNGAKRFQVPDYYDTKSGVEIANGKKYFNMGNVIWFTNLNHNRRHEELALWKRYTAEEYPTYDNYNAINVNKVADIPIDYNGYISVPVTFMNKYNPEQFEIVGMGEDNGTGLSGGVWNGGSKSCLVNGKAMFKRIFIKKH